MEDNVQTIVTVIISIFLLFIFPVYMAYEKKDDISYVLAMRYTQDLVDNVRSKGYLTKEMYEDYRARLKVTGNSYDIQLTHEYNRYDPITKYYKEQDGKYVIVRTSTHEERKNNEIAAIEKARNEGKLNNTSESDFLKQMYQDEGIVRIEDTYSLSKQVYTTDYILNVLNGEKKLLYNSTTDDIDCTDNNEFCQYAYVMNEDDNFNITIKNTNTTLATVMYNMVTVNAVDNNTRIYVNYGGSILASKWYGKIDYSQMYHDDIDISKAELVYSEDKEYIFTGDTKTEKVSIPKTDTDSVYTIEFDVDPAKTTELRAKGVTEIEQDKYNFALGSNSSEETTLHVSVGINGISLISGKNYAYSNNYTTGKVKISDISPFEKTDGLEGGYPINLELNTKRLIAKYYYRNKRSGYYSQALQMWVFWTYPKEAKKDVSITDSNNILEDGDVGEITYADVKACYDKGICNKEIKDGYTTYKINITDKSSNSFGHKSFSIEFYAIKSVVNINSLNQVILSYPTTINEYVNVRIEVIQKDNEKYVAVLYLDDEQVSESIELDKVPQVDLIGETFINGVAKYFNGNIKNIKIYEK